MPDGPTVQTSSALTFGILLKLEVLLRIALMQIFPVSESLSSSDHLLIHIPLAVQQFRHGSAVAVLGLHPQRHFGANRR